MAATPARRPRSPSQPTAWPANADRQDFAGGVGAVLFAMQQIEIAENAVDDERNGQNQIGGAVMRDRFGRHRIKAIGEDRAGSADRHILFDHRRAVIVEHLARREGVRRAVLRDEDQFGAPLGEAEEQGHHQAAQQQPGRRRNAETDAFPIRMRSMKPREIKNTSRTTTCFQRSRVANIHRGVDQNDEPRSTGMTGRQQRRARPSAAAKLQARANETAPLAIGLLHLVGWARSASTSKMSLTT